jgi:ribosomal protein S3
MRELKTGLRASGRVRSSAEIARREALQKGYVARLTRLAFLSPTIIETVAEGRRRFGTMMSAF